jgi:hypothetical protein
MVKGANLKFYTPYTTFKLTRVARQARRRSCSDGHGCRGQVVGACAAWQARPCSPCGRILPTVLVAGQGTVRRCCTGSTGNSCAYKSIKHQLCAGWRCLKPLTRGASCTHNQTSTAGGNRLVKICSHRTGLTDRRCDFGGSEGGVCIKNTVMAIEASSASIAGRSPSPSGFGSCMEL